MSQLATQPWTVEAFFAWQERQSERYELVGGLPLRLMAGAKNRHDDIAVNLIAELKRQLRGGPCRPFTSDGSVETYPGQIRRPDGGVDCGRRDPDAFLAAEPRMVAEIMSPSMRDYDTFEKLAEYRSVETLDYILFVEPNAPEVALWRRDDAREWIRDTIEGLDGRAAMPALGVELALADLYDGIEFPSSLQPLGIAPAHS